MRGILKGMFFIGLLVLGSPAGGGVILDDDFSGSQIDKSLWRYDPGFEGVTVSGGRMTVASQYGIWVSKNVPGPWAGYPYAVGDFFDVRVEQAGPEWGLEFGFVGSIGGWIGLGVDEAMQLTVFHSTDHGTFAFGLGTFVEGDYEIVWGPSLLKVSRNGDIKYSQTDPAMIPDYRDMSFGMWVHDGAVSFDRIRLSEIPEPGTVGMVMTGMLMLGGGWRLRRRWKKVGEL